MKQQHLSKACSAPFPHWSSEHREKAVGSRATVGFICQNRVAKPLAQTHTADGRWLWDRRAGCRSSLHTGLPRTFQGLVPTSPRPHGLQEGFREILWLQGSNGLFSAGPWSLNQTHSRCLTMMLREWARA